MNEQDNVQVVQKLYQALGAGDMPAVMAQLAEDMVLVSPGPADLLPWAGEYRGPEALLQFVTTLGQDVELSGMELQEFIAQGDKVVALVRHTGRVRATGRSYDLEWANVITLREGKIAAMRFYQDSYVVVEAVRPD